MTPITHSRAVHAGTLSRAVHAGTLSRAVHAGTLSRTVRTVRAVHAGRPRGWRAAAGLTCVAAGAAVLAGAFLPWVEAFAGLVQVPGVRGLNGQILAAAGAFIVAAGLVQLARGGTAARWAAGLAGFVAAGFSGYLLIQLTRTMRTLGGDSMVFARGGPGLWVAAAGSAAAFATLLFPAPATQTPRPVAEPATQTPRPEAGPATQTPPPVAGPATQTPPPEAESAARPPAITRRPALAWRSALAWAADRQSVGSRRALQIGLGVIWLLDAALQYQPYMFTRMFPAMMLAPAGMGGQPAFVSGPVLGAARLFATAPAAWNALFATIQLALAVGLLYRGTVRAALAGTVAWALAVWLLGEGLGGLFSPAADPLTGAPGAAVLYAFLAVLVWPARTAAVGPSVPGTAAARGSVPGATVASGSVPDPIAGRATAVRVSVADGSLLGRYARLAWLALWGSMAVLILRAPASAAPLTAAGGTRATLIVIGLAVAFALAAAGLLVPATVRPAVLIAGLAAAFIWVAGEHFGSLFSGSTTDPNTGPLLLLVAFAFWPRRQR